MIQHNRLNFNTMIIIIILPILLTFSLMAWYLYNTFLENKKSTLQQYALMTSKIISTIANQTQSRSGLDYKLFNQAFQNLQTTFTPNHKEDLSLEFLLGQRVGDKIIFLAYSFEEPKPVLWNDHKVAVPMRKALRGSSGTIIENDYKKEQVFAAYHNVPDTPWGLVIQQPYYQHISSFIYSALLYIIIMVLLLSFIFTYLYQLQQRANTYLKHSESRLYEIISTIDHWVWEVDARGIFTYASSQVENILGYKPEELIGKTAFDIMPKAEAHRVGVMYQKAVDEHKPLVNILNINLHKNGHEVKLLTNGSIYYDTDGKLLGYRGLSKDITQELADQEKIKNQEEFLIVQSRLAQMGELISMIAHQWRQPLSAISSVISLIRLKSDMHTLDEKFLQSKLSSIQEFTSHLSETIDDFRDFYKPSKEAISTTVNQPIQDAIKIVSETLKSENITLTQDYQSSKQFNLYANEIMQVILNILQNAQDNFLDKKITDAELSIQTYDEELQSIIKISDNGGGIAPDILDKVFDPYFSTKDSKNGTGLGMYMSKLIIEDHHSGK